MKYRVVYRSSRGLESAILVKLLIREKDPGTKDRIRTAIHVFADEPEV
jgi:hypothetical protein